MTSAFTDRDWNELRMILIWEKKDSVATSEVNRAKMAVFYVNPWYEVNKYINFAFESLFFYLFEYFMWMHIVST